MECEGDKTSRELECVASEKQQGEKYDAKSFREKDTGWNQETSWKKNFKWGKLKYILEEVISHMNRVGEIK